MVKSKRVTPEQAELVLRELAKRPADPQELVLELGLIPIEKSELKAAILKVLEENERAVEDYRAGKREAINFLTGKVLGMLKGRADPRKITKYIIDVLEKRRS
jgi:aspartyl-tRNA(Asn)/glutamyl-tRNA(Gln) amidotransferase subunit B